MRTVSLRDLKKLEKKLKPKPPRQIFFSTKITEDAKQKCIQLESQDFYVTLVV